MQVWQHEPMDPQTSQKVAQGVAVGRILYGLGMLLAPRMLLKPAGVSDPVGPFLWLARIFGIRDFMLGTGALVALLNESDAATGWVAAGAASDAADSVATLVWRDELGNKALPAGLFAASAGVLGAVSLPGVRASTRSI